VVPHHHAAVFLLAVPLLEFIVPFDPDNPASARDLQFQVRHHRERLRKFRSVQADQAREIAGKHYGDQGTPDRVAVPLLEMTYSIYTRKLIARNPRAHVTTEVPQLKRFAATLTEDLNLVTREVFLERAVRRCVRQAFMSMGIAKLGIRPGDPLARRYVESVSLDDWFHDTSARVWEDAGFMGNLYRLPKEQVRDNEAFDKTVRERLTATSRADVRDDGDERTADVSHGNEADFAEYTHYIDLMDVWLPRERLLVTLPWQAEGALRTLNWEGPGHGPYHLLGFGEIPDNFMPLAPGVLGLDMHQLANQLFLKSARQAGNQKTVYGYRGSIEEDAKRIRAALDGALEAMDDPDSLKAFSTRGVEPTTFALFLQAKSLFSWAMGNLDALGGLSPQSETLGQDQLLRAASSERLADMQKAVIDFVRAIITDLAWYEWNDPVLNRDIWRPIEGTELRVREYLAPHTRQGAFPQYDFDIVPYSMQDQSPAQRLQALMQIVGGVILPSLPLMVQQGISLDWRKLLALYSDYGDLPELSDILTFTAGPMGTMGPTGGGAPNTTRTYERINRPGATRGGQDETLTRSLLGAGVQGSEVDSLSRGVG
jgi:hypothetical protein